MPSLNLIAWDNGVGLSRDLSLLAVALEQAGFAVQITPIKFERRRRWHRLLQKALRFWRENVLLRKTAVSDANIMLEHIQPRLMPHARYNFFVPNPEWCIWGDLIQLDNVDAILTKTAHADAIFHGHGRSVAHIGFTSEDRYDPLVPRERTFFHLAGSSKNKGTQRLLELWRRHPEWPRLTVVQNPMVAKPVEEEAGNIHHCIDHVDDAQLRRLQNANLFHLCTSETEGWGHYLVEAMSVAAIVVTTNAPPMNELVSNDRGVLVDHGATGTQHLAVTYFFDEQALSEVVERLRAMPDGEVQQIGARARAWFLNNDREFSDRLRQAIVPLLD